MTGRDQLCGSRITACASLGGRDGLRVLDVTLEDGRRLVMKEGEARHQLAVEARMLERLRAEGAPVPEVHLASDSCLAMAHIDGVSRLCPQAQEDLGRVVGQLHCVPRPFFGYEETTPIAGLPQSNLPSDRWLPFFAEHRLVHMAELARKAGQLGGKMVTRVEKLASRLDRWLLEPAFPALLHGDLWGGNILVRDGRVAALIDPAVSYGHPEVELAFGTLFSTLSDAFFQSYETVMPIQPGFFEERKDLYNLYPLLVHACLYGGRYVGSIERTLERYGA